MTPRDIATTAASAARLAGCGTALVTPFNADGSLDEDALRAFVDWQIEEGIHFLVPCGSTGEAATMTVEEQRRVVEITAQQARGRVPVVGGAGSNDTQKAIALSTAMRDAGATHLLHTSPMYNKPPQRGIVAHYRAIAESTDLPIVVYNVPGRTGSNVEAKTTLELASIPGIVAVKEASGQLSQIADVIRGRRGGFSVLSGDDELTLPVMALGGDGIVSVISNATPRLMAQLCELMRAGDVAAAREIHLRLLPWMRAAFVESNPLPVKAALAMMGKMQNVLRLPLVPLADAHTAAVRSALVSAGALA
jgi:4-hydroxy-tetrahydrodipicolinate synthase